MALRTIIIEDEPLSRQYLVNLLSRFPEIEIIGKAATQEEAINMARSLQPDLLFLDIELHTGNGFEVLKRMEQPACSVVFTTALDHYAIKMIRLSAVPFLQKPIDSEELENTLRLLKAQRENAQSTAALSILMETLNNNNIPVHIALEQEAGAGYIVLDELIRIESAEDGTVLFLKNDLSKSSRRSIKDFEMLLSDFHFLRVNSGHLVNLKKVKEAARNGETVIMNDGSVIPLSAKKHAELRTGLSAVQNLH